MAPIRRLVMDLLKPHEPSTVALAADVADCPGVEGVNATLVETDREVQNVKLTVEGPAVDHDAVVDAVEDFGCALHSLDQVVAGERAVEDRATPQD